MAKQMVNPIERHVEKVVVGVAALVLVFAIARYLVTSPNQLELGGQTVTPRNIDAAVAKRADEVLSQLRNADPKIEIPEPLFEEFAKSLAPLEPKPLPAAVPFLPDVPIIDPPIQLLGRAKLVEVIAPAKPAVAHGRSTMSKGGTGPPYVPANWVTVSALFEYKKQVDTQKRAYGATQEELFLLPAEIQRQKLRADGAASEGDWEDVQPWPAGQMSPVPEIELVDSARGDAKLVPSEDAKALENFAKFVTDLPRQRDFARPLMAEIVNGAKWGFPILTTYNDVLKQDQQYMPSSGSEPRDLYGLGSKPTTAAPKALTPEQQIDAHLKEIEALLASAKKSKSINDTYRANNKAIEIMGSPVASASQKSRAESLKREADQVERDIKRWEMTGPQGGQSTGPATQETRRQPEPVQQIWVHDAAEGSIANTATYQYRMRFRIFNQFAGLPEKFDDPNDAAKVVLVSEWSEPSDAITFDPVFMYFVTYDDKNNREIGVEFFRWYYGVWLKSRRQKLGIGDLLYTKHRTPAPSLTDPTAIDEPEVEWACEEVVVDLDFGRKVQERKPGRGPGGVTFGQVRDDTAVILMGPDGRLAEKYVSLDRDHPAKREAAARVWTPHRR